MSERNRELLNLTVVAMLTALGFASVYIARQAVVSTASLSYAAFFFALYLVAHLVARYAVPHADPYLLPMAALLTAMGLTEIYRLNPDNAFKQGLWIVIAVGVFSATLLLLGRDYRVLESYKYLFGLSAIFLLVLPALPGFGTTVNGARLWVRAGPLQFQPGELAKLTLIVFLAGYLREKREVIAQGRVKDLGPLLVIWGGAMLVLVETNDLGSGLLYFGVFLAMLYVATGKFAYVIAGSVLFVIGSAGVYKISGHVRDRVEIWLHPFKHAQFAGYQLVQARYSIAHGGVGGTGLGHGTFTPPGSHTTYIPYLNTDFIFAALAQELGLIGVAGLLLVYMLIVARGFRIALLTDDGFSKLLAVGLTFAFALQAFIIVGGIIGLIPLTGITMPFVSYGGSSVVANFVLLAGLMLVSNRANTVQGDDVNKQITRLAVGALVLLSALIVGTTYWQTFAVAGLADRQDNALARVAQFTVDRGNIYTARGHVPLAVNDKRRVDGQTYYFRKYPNGYLAPHVVGYSTQSRSRAGIERSQNDYLTGANGNFSSVTQRELDKLKGVTLKGNDLLLTLSPRAQQTAVRQLAGKCGGAVAIEPQTGRILALASSPTYNPNAVEKSFSAITKIRTRGCRFAAPLLDRATQGLYPPGSTFKVVTAAAALDSGAYKPTSEFVDPGYCEEYGKRVSNAGNPESPETFGRVTLAQGLQHSINSVFCNVGKQIGAGKILEYAKRFGFYATPDLELPADAQSPSGLYKKHKLFAPRHPEYQVDPGRLAFGQEAMIASPIQMAMVAATVANHGVLMQPHLLQEVVSPDGKVVHKVKPEKVRRVISRRTADELTEMMKSVVTGGTATNLQSSGLDLAGKTGTAETGVNGKYDTWFIAFAPANDPKVAVAVALENQTGFGATTAGPIAKSIVQAVLPQRSNNRGSG